MASDKQKRFRTHVVKELYETEKDYTSALEFTVTVNGACTAHCETGAQERYAGEEMIGYQKLVGYKR